MDKTTVFFLAIVLPLVYYRSLYFIYRNYFKISKLRRSSGLQIHHIHYGILLTLIAGFLLVFLGESIYIVGILGFGLGFMLDEFVAAMFMPGDRETEMKAYSKSLPWTLLLLLLILTLGFLVF